MLETSSREVRLGTDQFSPTLAPGSVPHTPRDQSLSFPSRLGRAEAAPPHSDAPWFSVDFPRISRPAPPPPQRTAGCSPSAAGRDHGSVTLVAFIKSALPFPSDPTASLLKRNESRRRPHPDRGAPAAVSTPAHAATAGGTEVLAAATASRREDGCGRVPYALSQRRTCPFPRSSRTKAKPSYGVRIHKSSGPWGYQLGRGTGTF